MATVKVANIKCGGCERTIKDALEKAGATNVQVDHATQTVSFAGDKDVMYERLSKLGYPKASSPEAKKILKKARSFLSCAIGKTKK